MKETKSQLRMQHFLNLEKCSCGAYKYLAVREHKKSYEIYLIHHRHFSTGQNVRKYSKLASIPKFKLNIHDQRVDQQQNEKTVRLSNDEVSALKSVLRQLDTRTVQSEEPENYLESTPDVELAEDSEKIETTLT